VCIEDIIESPAAPAGGGAGLSRRHWLLLITVFAGLHYLALWVSIRTGNFDPNPNHDHVRIMHQVLESGRPRLAVWPPGFGYYLAFRWRLTEALGLPYWSAKLFVDVVPVVLSGVLSVLLARRLTGSRPVAVASGLAMVGSPIFALASAEDLAVVLFQPFFLGALLALVRALQGAVGSSSVARFTPFAGAGALLGLSCLVRANPQLLLVALAPVVWWWLRHGGARRPVRTAAAGVVLALAVQALVLLPWSVLQRQLGQSGAVAAPVVYYAFFDGIRRHDGFQVSEALRDDPDPPPLTLSGVFQFHREWLRRDPAALARLYAAKAVRTWYLSDSGRWDRAILLVHAPLWILALAGLALWLWSSARDPALWLVVTTILYLWAVSAAVSGLARYMAPVYGLLGLLAAWLPAALLGSATRPEAAE
jgi:hypothetical protein